VSVTSAVVSDRLSTDAVAHVARLARLNLTADELERATAQLGDMLAHFADIDALDLSDVEPMTQPLPLVNVMRDDIEGDVLDRAEVLAEAPDADLDGGRFRVPPIGTPQ
jgi:aspartyl-tRNA(Asn)/glutamyl-tRNA(Gln) amidotransferase subunit C